MALVRPTVSVYKHDAPAEKKAGSIQMPLVMSGGLRPDLVNFVWARMRKNKRQAHGIKMKAGYEYAAESWGTGRAVARIPRIPGSGTHAAGQGAFGNMCRGGGMFAPLRTWRRWHRKINVRQKRAAVCTALVASSLVPLVMARGHRINDVREIPLVVSNGAQEIKKTKEAVKLFKGLGCDAELQRIIDTRTKNTGKRRWRIGKYKIRRGPLVIYKEDKGIVKAMRNLPGVETMNVKHINLLNLAPGGHFGRFCVWTEDAFKYLSNLYGNNRSKECPLKKGFRLPRNEMENADLSRIINSDEVQQALNPKKERPAKFPKKANAFKHEKLMEKLNPGSTEVKAAQKRACEKGTPENAAKLKNQAAKKADRKAYRKKEKQGKDTWFKRMMTAFENHSKTEDAAAEAEEE